MTEDDDDDGPDAWHNQPTPRPPRKKKSSRKSRLEHHGLTKDPAVNAKKPGRRKRPGRPRKRREDPYRLSPAYRKTTRWKTVIMPEEAYMQLREIATFYKLSISQMVAQLIEPAFKKAYEESMTLARIEANREKEKERVESLKRKTDEAQTPDNPNPPRRTHF